LARHLLLSYFSSAFSLLVYSFLFFFAVAGVDPAAAAATARESWCGLGADWIAAMEVMEAARAWCGGIERTVIWAWRLRDGDAG
jgi:hypothetical protein